MSGRRLGVAAALVKGRWVRGDVQVLDGRVAAIGLPAARGGRRAVPGFVDLQVNGFGGTNFSMCDRPGFDRASIALARRGVTSFLPTITTSPLDRYGHSLGVAAEAIARPVRGARPIGVHLEGPFLSPSRPGAHRREWLAEPDIAHAAALCDAAPVALMTLAPELEGADELVAYLRSRGVVVAAGHSDADAGEAHTAFDGGVAMVTHLWNAQRQMTSREPALGGVALARRDVFVGIIADGVHLASETVLVAMAAAGDRAVVVSDAAAVAGLPDGAHECDGRRVVVSGGAVRLTDGTLAGGASALDVALRNLVHWGIDLEIALAAMSSAPAAVLGRGDIGALATGRRADIVVLDESAIVEQVLIGGESVL